MSRCRIVGACISKYVKIVFKGEWCFSGGRLLGSNTSMWRIRCSHSARDTEPAVSAAGGGSAGAEEQGQGEQVDFLAAGFSSVSLTS